MFPWSLHDAVDDLQFISVQLIVVFVQRLRSHFLCAETRRNFVDHHWRRYLHKWHRWRVNTHNLLHYKTSSVAAGFGRHGMPPPASNDTGTAFCFPELRRGRDETYRWFELMTLTFDIGGHHDCQSWRSRRLWLMRVVVLHPQTKFEVCRPWHLEDMAHDVCQH